MVQKIITINPATEEKINEYNLMDKQELNFILHKVNEAYKIWRDIALNERIKLILEISNVLKTHKNKYAELMTIEMGKPIKQSMAEIEKCAWAAEVYAENAEKWLAEEDIAADGILHRVAYYPLGVILGVMPWNFPFWQVFRFAIPALLVGNSCILKHASNVSGCALAIEDIIKKAGFPDNVFRTIITDHNAVAFLLKNELVRAVSLTGSTTAGSQIASIAGKNIKKIVLELGGSDPFIVLEDINIDFVAENAVFARFQNTGQSCIASKRFIVMRQIAQQFINAFVKRVKKLKTDNPLLQDTDIGPLVNKNALLEIEQQINDAVTRGANILTGGKRLDKKGYFYAPTVLHNVTQDMRVSYEEVFGPVAPIFIVDSYEQAIELANNSEFGLGGCVWSRDLKKAEKIARKIEAGTVFVNCFTKSDPRIPFGGVKKSGIGRELSHFGLKELANIKTINVYNHK